MARAELIEGVELGLSSTKTEAGSWKATVGEADDGLPEGAEGDEAVGPVTGPALRDGL